MSNETIAMRGTPVGKIVLGQVTLDPAAVRRGNAPGRSFQRQCQALEALGEATLGARWKRYDRHGGFPPWGQLTIDALPPEPAFELARAWLALALDLGLTFACRESRNGTWALSMQTGVML